MTGCLRQVVQAVLLFALFYFTFMLILTLTYKG